MYCNITCIALAIQRKLLVCEAISAECCVCMRVATEVAEPESKRSFQRLEINLAPDYYKPGVDRNVIYRAGNRR